MITIVTLYREGLAESFVGAVEGSITEEQRRDLAEKWEASYKEDEEEEEEEDADLIYFQEVEVVELSCLKNLKNADDRGSDDHG